MQTKILPPTEENIKRAVEFLKKGEVLAAPTETVYGLIADAFSFNAIEGIFKIKDRPKNKALICNIGSFEMLYRLTPLKSSFFMELVKRFWPGPLTVVVEKLPCVLDSVTAKQNTVAIRFSSNEILTRITNLFGGPLVVPSANISESGSKINPFDVYNELNGRIRYIIDGGISEFKVESTIVAVKGEKLKILRQGIIGEKIKALYNIS